jgi:beta-1,2-mannobiose phosphorylase / 1,2-beta-oligomannan phosphorylase
VTRAPRELFVRHPGNPILTADDWPYPCNVVFNPGAAQTPEGTVLLVRVEQLDGISHLTVARSADGVDGWTIDETPLLASTPGVETEQWGFEDPRIVRLDELGAYAITSTAYGLGGPAVHLATTTDFVTVANRGIIMRAEDKNAALLPERVGGDWILFHRPMLNVAGAPRGGIDLSRSSDLVTWSAPEGVLRPRDGAFWDSLRIGIGPPLIKTEEGWLLIYHGVKETVTGGVYRLGLALLDLDEPTRVLRRARNWVLGPATYYERVGDVPSALFSCGLVHDEPTGTIRLYYGAADTSIGLATARLDDLLAAVLAAPD